MDQEARKAKRELFDRLDDRLAWNVVMLGRRTSEPNLDDVYALGDLIELHHYLKEVHVFAPGEVEALLCFMDPLVVAQNCWCENRHPDGYPICKILEDIDAYKQFPLTKVEQERRNEPLVQQLKKRLDENFAAYTAALMDKSKQDLLAESESIATTQAAYEYMRNDFDYSYGKADLLLKLDDPLKYLAAHWSLSFDLSGDDDDTIEEIITDLEDPVNLRHAQEAAAPIQAGKPSVLDQLHKTVQETSQRPTQEGRPHRKSDAPNL